MRFANVFVGCLVVLGVLQAIANVVVILIPILDQLAWPGAVISYGLFLLVGAENIFDHTAAFSIFSLIFNATIFAAVVYVVVKVGRIVLRKEKGTGLE